MSRSFDALHAEIERLEKRVRTHLNQERFRRWFGPADLRDAAFAYVNRPAKRLRPAVLLLSCRAVGGDEEVALPVAAAIELVHTWTLTHDDLIDDDSLRRGLPTVHVLMRDTAPEGAAPGRPDERDRYGRRAAILVGDAQHAWSVAALLEAAMPDIEGRPTERCVDAAVILAIAHILESKTVQDLIRGEALDIRYEAADRRRIDEQVVVEMLRLKTGVLYEFCAMAGAMIGLGTTDPEHGLVKALARFAGSCGVAFQLQDDILGITGDEAVIGKPVGSDIREGKCTTIVLHALRHARPHEVTFIEAVLGDKQATEAEVDDVRGLFSSLGSIAHTKRLAAGYIAEGLRHLRDVPESSDRQLLEDWAAFVLERIR